MQPLDILQQYWHHKVFRPLQEEIIASVLEGKDTLALLPTGGGKSLCFQVPAMARPGLCLVISPLVALMKDQTDHLRRKNITAFSLNSGMSRKEVINTLQLAGHSNCKFLYVSPERLETDLFAEYLPSLPVNLVAVDEAHCVSQWGYDFRPTYLRIAALREQLPQTPILALTASATPDVLEDITDKLQLRQPALFRGSFTRPHLSYSFFKVDSKIHKIAEILRKVPGSSIVYCKTRRATGELSEQLGRMGFRAGAYHAGLTQEERSRRQDDWIKDRIQVVVSTNAFGMGIDKSAVRTVIHADPPDSVENYYQEAGRAGRDGDKAYAVLLAGQQDLAQLETLPDKKFPSPEQIRPVYQDLMNYLQLPIGSGKGNYYDFDLSAFVNKFRIDHQTALNTIKVLEQEGLMNFQQQVFLPAKARFLTNKEALYDFEKDHPTLEPLIDALLRTYEGIFDQAVPIREKQLAFITRKEAGLIVEELIRLQAFHIIDYIPQKTTPQLYIIRERPAAEDLYIEPISYRMRKERYATRIRTMIRYGQLKEECRSRFLANYFGDKQATDCGICDNCRARR
ncbi:MAG TPA: ATP-dependent DNA helicase RecQ [Puia sp.]|nr:ATP-dependent DNA helicase RecQ [Puia sp.]